MASRLLTNNGMRPVSVVARVCAALLLIAGIAAHLASQGGASARVLFSSLPAFGRAGQIRGNVFGASAADVRLYVFEFVPDIGWYPTPNCGWVPISGSGEFSIDGEASIMDRYATRFAAYLVPASLPVPCLQPVEFIPLLIERNALDYTAVPRIAQYKTIAFSGLEWYVKTAPVRVSPGPQFFAEENVSVDSAGRLHLKVSRVADSWVAAEVYTKERVGLGSYRFTVDSQLNTLDPNLTLGLFTWDELAADQFHREWDIEFARWGFAGATFNAQYVVQPYNNLHNMYQFLMSPAAPSTHTVNWSPGQLDFQSASAVGGAAVSHWTYSGSSTPVPTAGDARLHLNFYVGANGAPATSFDREIVISRVQYNPIGQAIGFTRPLDSVSFLATTNAVPTAPIDSSGLGCTATAESDSPWLTVVSGLVPSGGVFQYSVADNNGAARTGNLILRSTNCNLTLGRQILTVNQAGLVCDPAFADPSTHIGFLDTFRSVFIRGTSPTCSWRVTSSAPWIRITSAATGAGDGAVQISADANSAPELRQGGLQLDNNKQHSIYQDASINYLALSPQAFVPCGVEPSQFALAWKTPADMVEVRLNSPSGILVGSFGSTGVADLTNLPDGTLIYLIQPSGAGAAQRVLASARATVRPADCSAQAMFARQIVNAASLAPLILAAGSMATVKGSRLASSPLQAGDPPYPPRLGGAEVQLGGISCLLSYVSPGQINFIVPEIRPGRYVLSIGSATAEVIVAPVAPGIFTISGDGAGVPWAGVTAALTDGGSRSISAYRCDNTGCLPLPLEIPSDAKELFVVLYGTGFHNVRSASATLGGSPVEVLYAGPQTQYPGYDQLNLHLTNLQGLSGRQTLVFTADGQDSNPVDLLFR